MQMQMQIADICTGWLCPRECLMASPVTLFTSANAGYPSSSLILMLCLMSFTQCYIYVYGTKQTALIYLQITIDR